MTGAAIAEMGGGGSGGGTFTAMITGGFTKAHGTLGSHTFGANTCTASGGAGGYTFQWHENDDGGGTWSSSAATSATSAPSVSGVAPAGEISFASYYCIVTDMAGATAVSNVATYGWQNVA